MLQMELKQYRIVCFMIMLRMKITQVMSGWKRVQIKSIIAHLQRILLQEQVIREKYIVMEVQIRLRMILFGIIHLYIVFVILQVQIL